ncbi:MAG: 16S rRNA (cytidine(1402)-2'-O)-methyltransferase [Lachnospiraceae bacterium]|nr:16S rRNA (cytidine(1402)-2'-O)-methyltransferase [Lachnospiraceae bacterium]
MAIEKGTLYLCATPIGNLGDMTERVLEALEGADIIAAEDTRNTLKLLNHFGIQGKLTSYHEHNKYDKAETLVRDLLDGKSVALVTDAGTPAISDPGEILVRRCIDAGIPVTSLPGATAFVTALTLSGLDAGRFVFEGFLPAEKKRRSAVLEELSGETRTVIIYEAPHRLKETLKSLSEALGNRRIAVCRELTKLHEEVLRLDLKGALSYYEDREPKGEFVLVIEGCDPSVIEKEKREKWEELSLSEHLQLYLSSGCDRKEAMKNVAKDRGVPKRDIYNLLLKEEENEEDQS